jgi:hypothetical protein
MYFYRVRRLHHPWRRRSLFLLLFRYGFPDIVCALAVPLTSTIGDMLLLGGNLSSDRLSEIHDPRRLRVRRPQMLGEECDPAALPRIARNCYYAPNVTEALFKRGFAKRVLLPARLLGPEDGMLVTAHRPLRSPIVTATVPCGMTAAHNRESNSVNATAPTFAGRGSLRIP